MTTVSFSRQESTQWWPKTVNCRHFSDHCVIFGCKNVTVLPPASTLHPNTPPDHNIFVSSHPNSLIMTEKEKMLAGMVYSAVDEQLLDELNAVKAVVHKYNLLSPADVGGRLEVLKGLLGAVGDDDIIINQPFYCDYGKQISVGKRFFANFHFTVLDEAKVTIGDDCFIGPNVSIYTACHSTDPVERNTRREWAEPVTIVDNVWIGGSVTILPGVTIGDNVTIGAGSVVTKDIPSNVVAVGNPCRVIKHL